VRSFRAVTTNVIQDIALVAPCSGRKKCDPEVGLRGQDLPAGALADVADNWASRIRSAGNLIKARNLYGGRGFCEALAAARDAAGHLFIVSAGLGLRSAEDTVPAYSLTVADRDPDSIWRAATRSNSSTDPRDWWRALCGRLGKPTPVADLIVSRPLTLFLLALPLSYLRMIAADLDTLASPDRERIRLVGPNALDETFDSTWPTNLMPYDDRLDGEDSLHRGTRSDFPQRAARHFVNLIRNGHLNDSAVIHAELVRCSLEMLRAPERPRRPRYSDAELKRIIGDLFDETDGRSSESLRRLRRERHIACEQGRFRKLFWQVAQAKGASHGEA
jgi:hypothetical protein